VAPTCAWENSRQGWGCGTLIKSTADCSSRNFAPRSCPRFSPLVGFRLATNANIFRKRGLCLAFAIMIMSSPMPHLLILLVEAAIRKLLRGQRTPQGILVEAHRHSVRLTFVDKRPAGRRRSVGIARNEGTWIELAREAYRFVRQGNL
jgi:hypothetical protein